MSRIEITNITSQTLYFTQLSVPDTQIDPGASIDLTEFNTYQEIKEDEELLQYLEDGKVSINNGYRDLSSAQSLNVFEDENVHGSHFCYETSLPSVTTTDQEWVTKVTMSSDQIPAGQYRIGWQYNWDYGASTSVEFRVLVNSVVVQDGEASQLAEKFAESGSNAERTHHNSGFSYAYFEAAGSHTIELQFRTPVTPGAQCWNASLEFWRVR
jgi:hypothetical protein